MDATIREIRHLRFQRRKQQKLKVVPQDCWSATKIRPMKRTSTSLQQRYASKWIPYSQAAGPSIHPTERRCGETFLLRSSAAFCKQWKAFLEAACLSVTPAFYQHVTDLIFQVKRKLHYKRSRAEGGVDSPVLTTTEANALRYGVGYV